MRFSLIIFFLTTSFTIFSQKISKQLSYQDIELIDGSTIKQSELKQKVIIANLWGTWCKPCIEEIPDLNQLVDSYKENNEVIFIAVADPYMDSPDKIMNFLEKRSFDFNHMIPAKESMFFELTGNIIFPTTILYDKNGRFVKKFTDTLTEKEIEKIRKLINELTN
ncbi:TlpA family protein disulfide reductase [Ekhidna sp.]|uniref:TlpA family protein disulfide reductase n=1 Tax=Ekhidna sp. TaxID=2608089 RepID=UPI003C7E7E0D